jgi:tetratricopeptide (TPR) repeat protein
VTVAIYAQVVTHDFVDLDDTGYVVTNVHVNTGLTTDNIRWAFTTGYAANWHPLTWISHQLDASVFGARPGPQHAVNVGWHVLNTLMLFGLLRFMTGAVWRSAFVAALFAVHPVHVESVAWIAERKDVLSTFFWLATTWAYVAWLRRPAAWRYGAMLVLFALGLMAKPMLVTLPFTLLLLDLWPLGRAAVLWSRRIVEKLPLFALVIASSIITAIVQRQGGAVGTLSLVPLSDRLANAVLSYGRYLKAFVWPVDLAVFYPYVNNLPILEVAGAGLVLVAISALVWRLRASQPYLLVGWLWFVGTLVPVIGLVQIGMQALADRYTYVPYIGLFVAITWGGRAFALRRHVGPTFQRVVAAGVVLTLSAVAFVQAQTWANSEALWTRAVIATTDNARAHNSLGVIYGNDGSPEEAILHFREALRLNPDMSEAKHIYANLGHALMAQGKVADALPNLLRAKEFNPDRADVCNDLGLAYFGLNRTDEALAAWREAVRINPQFEAAYFTMGIVLAGNHQVDEARHAFLEVLRINPSRKDAQDALKALGK